MEKKVMFAFAWMKMGGDGDDGDNGDDVDFARSQGRVQRSALRDSIVLGLFV